MPSNFLGASFTEEPVKKPYEYFTQFFDKDLISLITEQTNLYYTQEKLGTAATTHFSPTTDEEIEQLLGIFLYTGIFHVLSIGCIGVKSLSFQKLPML